MSTTILRRNSSGALIRNAATGALCSTCCQSGGTSRDFVVTVTETLKDESGNVLDVVTWTINQTVNYDSNIEFELTGGTYIISAQLANVDLHYWVSLSYAGEISISPTEDTPHVIIGSPNDPTSYLYVGVAV